ncbi:hypothetical protein Peur_037304 [Populus x canadensis]
MVPAHGTTTHWAALLKYQSGPSKTTSWSNNANFSSSRVLTSSSTLLKAPSTAKLSSSNNIYLRLTYRYPSTGADESGNESESTSLVVQTMESLLSSSSFLKLSVLVLKMQAPALVELL